MGISEERKQHVEEMVRKFRPTIIDGLNTTAFTRFSKAEQRRFFAINAAYISLRKSMIDYRDRVIEELAYDDLEDSLDLFV